MAIALATTRQSLADHYTSLGSFIGLAIGPPGDTNTPANEATGGSPAYARKQTTWTPGGSGVSTGSPVTIDVPAGTYTHILLAADAAGPTMVDNADVTDLTMSTQGQIVVTPTYTQT